MQKDVIYIDVDDDVTAIIGKVKAAKEKIVAVVPPKRPGALQSAVNLRLLDRMAKADKKHLVLITNNAALMALAANASIPVAKNLQSKPEIAEIPALSVDDGDDIIDGAQIPVGEHAKSTMKVHDGTRAEKGRSDAIEEIELEETAAAATPVVSARRAAAAGAGARAAKKQKIPNFDSFRKKLFIGIGAGVLLVGVLVWAFVFAPAATILVTASASPAPVSASVRLGGTEATNFEEGVIRSVMQEKTEDETIEFDATGTKQVGEEATGTIRIENCDGSAFTIPAGTVFTASTGQQYRSNSAISVGALNGSASACRGSGSGAGTGSGAVTAVEVGAESNQAARSRGYTIQGISGDIYASGSAMTGGSSREARVVSAADIERAQGDLIGRSSDTKRDELSKLFTNGEKVIASSFSAERSEITASPALNEEVAENGKATLTMPVTYVIYAIPSADLEEFLKKSLEQQIDEGEQQRVYNTGIDSASIANFRRDGDALTAVITTEGQIGPELDEAAIKELVKGKIFGEVQTSLQALEGVREVDVRFSFFWVRTVPNNTDKIDVQFEVENE